MQRVLLRDVPDRDVAVALCYGSELIAHGALRPNSSAGDQDDIIRPCGVALPTAFLGGVEAPGASQSNRRGADWNPDAPSPFVLLPPPSSALSFSLSFFSSSCSFSLSFSFAFSFSFSSSSSSGRCSRSPRPSAWNYELVLPVRSVWPPPCSDDAIQSDIDAMFLPKWPDTQDILD